MTANARRAYFDHFATAILLIAVAVIYGRTIVFGFVDYDDHLFIYNNPYVQNPFTAESLRWCVTTFSTGNWQPVTWLSHMLDYQLFGDWAGGHHLTNFVIHAANALLLGYLLRRITGARWRSWAVAMLFAVHPMAVESVAWVSERKNVLSTFFWLAATLAYVGYVRRPHPWRYLWMTLLFAIGLMSKAMLVTFPCTLLLLDVWPLRRPRGWQKLIIEKLPLLAIAIAFSALTIKAQHAFDMTTQAAQIPLLHRPGVALVGYVTYLRHLVWPVDLTILYPHPSLIGDRSGWPLGDVLGAAAVLIALTGAFVRLGMRRRWRFAPVGWFWFLGTMFPVSGVIQVGSHAVTDRHTYVPYIGLYVLVVFGAAALLARLRPWRQVAAAAMVLWLTALTIASCYQVSHWRSTFALFSRALAVTEHNALAHHLMGIELLKFNQFDKARRQLETVVEIDPLHGKAYNTLGVIAVRQGRDDDAEAHWRKAIEVKPSLPHPYVNLGDLAHKRGQINDAVHYYLEALKRFPTDWLEPDEARVADQATWLIATTPALGRPPDMAVRMAEHNLQRHGSGNPKHLRTLAAAYANAGQFDRALDALNQAAALASASRQTDLLKQLAGDKQLYDQRQPLHNPSSGGP